MREFEKQDLKDWFTSPVTTLIMAELKELRTETLEAVLCTPRGERADVTFRVEGMDLMLNKLREKGV